jgi:hypothetical protein
MWRKPLKTLKKPGAGKFNKIKDLQNGKNADFGILDMHNRYAK